MKYYIKNICIILLILVLNIVIALCSYFIFRNYIFDKLTLIRVTAITFIIFISVTIGLINTFRISKIQSLYSRLLSDFEKSMENNDIRYDSLCNRIQTNREIELDIYEEVKEKCDESN